MENNVIEILPLKGSNFLTFGAKEKDILAKIGEPDEKEEFQEDGVDTAIWYYDDLCFSLYLDNDGEPEMVLTGFDVDCSAGEDVPSLKLCGTSIAGKPIGAIRTIAKKNDFGEEEEDMEEWGEKRLSYDEQMLDFYFDENDNLLSVSWSVE